VGVSYLHLPLVLPIRTEVYRYNFYDHSQYASLQDERPWETSARDQDASEIETKLNRVEPPTRSPPSTFNLLSERYHPYTMSNSVTAVTRQMSALDLNKQQITKPTTGALRKQPSQTNVSKMLSKYAAPAPGHTRTNSASTRLPQKPPVPPPVKKTTSTTSLNKFQKPKFVPTKSTATALKKQPSSTLNQAAKPKPATVKPSEPRSKSPTETIASTTSSSRPEPIPSPLLQQPPANEIGSYDGGLENDAAAAAREPSSEETEELLNVNSSYSE
jgi:hypothetical protein